MRRGGTGTRTPFDTTRAAQAMQVPGIDPRHWISYGTVCTMGDDGTPNYADPQAVFTSPDGCMVDVLLHPAMQHVTCRYSGVQGGASGTIFTPINPGDEVLVEIPDGDLREAPVITRVMSAEHSRLPMGADRKPIWQNDRILVHGANVPVHIRTSGGSEIYVNPDGTVELGSKDATEQLVKGTTYRSGEAQMNQALINAIVALNTASQAMLPSDITVISGLAPTVGAFLTAFKVFSPLWLAAVQTFESGSNGYLSTVVKTS